MATALEKRIKKTARRPWTVMEVWEANVCDRTVQPRLPVAARLHARSRTGLSGLRDAGSLFDQAASLGHQPYDF
ncbi:MAG TPA: hypothetical protein VFU48_07505, partial [Nitrospira sp.]|nr:hypothetical protein [Nitrospira sp.]